MSFLWTQLFRQSDSCLNCFLKLLHSTPENLTLFLKFHHAHEHIRKSKKPHREGTLFSLLFHFPIHFTTGQCFTAYAHLVSQPARAAILNYCKLDALLIKMHDSQFWRLEVRDHGRVLVRTFWVADC